jgi:hypothetical protein
MPFSPRPFSAWNFVIAEILLAIAARPPAGREFELATEIHGTAVDALQLEARALQSQLSEMIHHPLNGTLPLLLAPLYDHRQRPEEAGNEPNSGGSSRGVEVIASCGIGLKHAN